MGFTPTFILVRISPKLSEKYGPETWTQRLYKGLVSSSPTSPPKTFGEDRVQKGPHTLLILSAFFTYSLARPSHKVWDISVAVTYEAIRGEGWIRLKVHPPWEYRSKKDCDPHTHDPPDSQTPKTWSPSPRVGGKSPLPLSKADSSLPSSRRRCGEPSPEDYPLCSTLLSQFFSPLLECLSWPDKNDPILLYPHFQWVQSSWC